MKYAIYIILIPLLLACSRKEQEESRETPPSVERWSAEKAWAYYNAQPWGLGTNFNPSTSINQLEFWQAETYDTATIDRELAWSAELGMNLHRVYLHDLLWSQDATAFLSRLDDFLERCDKNEIRVMFVLLDDVWHPVPQPGKQPEPIPHVHNSGWVQSPGAAILGDSARHKELKPYIQGVIRHFRDDPRVAYWDLYNEPDNVAGGERAELEVPNKKIYSLALLKKVFTWAREINPVQPLTVGFWKGDPALWGTPDSLPDIDRYVALHSDVISFHAYDGDTAVIRQKIASLKSYGRPLLCTEYLARGAGNTFETILPIFRENNVAAINWGFVSGKTNTIYPWSSWSTPFTDEPEIWHHDILRPDGTPYSENEVSFLKSIMDITE
jgi:hypothetical protein